MNSNAFSWEFSTVGIDLGRGFEWKKQYVERVHVPKCEHQNQEFVKKIEGLVEKILNRKDKETNNDTKRLESRINDLIYDFHELNSDEIKILQEESEKIV